jgi:hypothetical protein
MAAKDFTLLILDLHNIFYYKDGSLYWKISKSKVTKDKKAGWIQKNGYDKVELFGQTYCQHRVIFLMHHGYLPKVVDHIDGNKHNNKIENLRAADHSKNTLYSRKNSRNTSGVKGVHFCKQSRKWKARICIDGKRKLLGLFNDLELAELVMMEAREKYHGEFAHHG